MPSTNSYTDTAAILVERCKAADNKAFKELYQLYAKAMYNICVRMLNDDEEAKDVLQESFISAFNNIRQYDGSASFGSWLKRIVINRCIDAVKRRPGLVPLDVVDVAEEESFEEEEFSYDVEAIKQAVQQLPDGYRIILTLYLFEDYSHRMIAEKLKITESTSKSQYSRARKKLIVLITEKNSCHGR